MTRQEAERRAQRGAAYLDRVRPGWFREISAEHLDMSEDCDCVIGQLTGSFSDHYDKMVPSGFEEYYGFHVGRTLTRPFCSPSYAKLTRAWKAIVIAKQAEDVPAAVWTHRDPVSQSA